MPQNTDWDSLPELESAVWQVTQRLPPAMAKKMYNFIKKTWTTALAELRRDSKAPARPEDRRTHFVRAWISDTLWRLYQAGDNWSADPQSMGIDAAEAEDIFSRVLSRPRVLPDEAGGKLPVPPRQWHVVTQAVEDTFEELSEARVADAAGEKKKKRPAKPKPFKGKPAAARAYSAPAKDWDANADIPFWARKLWERGNDNSFHASSWQGDDQGKDSGEKGKGRAKGKDKGKDRAEKGKDKGKGKGKSKDKDKGKERCKSDSPCHSRSRSREERLGGRAPAHRSRSWNGRERSRRRPPQRMTYFETGRVRPSSRSRRRDRNRERGRRRRSRQRIDRPRSAGRSTRRGARAPPYGTRMPSPSPKVTKREVIKTEPREPTAQCKVKPKKARSRSSGSYNSDTSSAGRAKARAKPKVEESEREEEEEEEEEAEEAEEASGADEAPKMAKAKSKAKARSRSGSESSERSAGRPQEAVERTASQEPASSTKKSEADEKSEEDEDVPMAQGTRDSEKKETRACEGTPRNRKTCPSWQEPEKAETEAGEAEAEPGAAAAGAEEDTVDVENDMFDDIDDEKLMAKLQQGLMIKVEEAESAEDTAEKVVLVECRNRSKGTCLGLRAENGEEELEHKLLFPADTARGGFFTGTYCKKCAEIVEFSWRVIAAA